MPSPTPLKDLELVDCARANAKQGITIAAKQCGYGEDLNTFSEELKQACDRMGIQINELSDLLTPQDNLISTNSQIIAPDTPSEL